MDSVLMQETNFDFEIIVGDDSSTDLTLDILNREYGGNSRVKIFSNYKNLGPFRNIKKILGKARGEYISLLDGDDFFTDPEKLQRQVDFLDSHHEFFMHCTGYQVLTEDNNFLPEDGFWHVPLRPVLTSNDLLEANLVTFGRTFRNHPDLIKTWMENCPYLDWAFNFECSLRGKIMCENWSGGVYRHSQRGMFSMKTEDEKLRMNIVCIGILKERLRLSNKKITIIDCFVRNKRIEEKLKSTIEKLKNVGEDILLITNMPPDSEIIKMCDFFIYDRRNQLFESPYDNVNVVDFHINLGSFSVHNLKPGLQRHGLSVLVNLTNALSFVREMGYKYFQRVEVDDIFGEISLDRMSSIFKDCISLGKKACFYFNENEMNVSFHYFVSEIEFFCNKVPKIKSEDDFRDYLISKRGNYDFVIAEEFIFQNINDSRNEILVKNGGQMFLDFPDTSWNTETSGSNMDAKYRDCLTGIYKIINSVGEQTGFAIMSYNYGENRIERKIICKSKGGNDLIFHHSLECLGAWVYHILPSECHEIEVFENDEIVLSEKKDNIISYLQF